MKQDDIYRTLASRLRQERHRAGLSLEALAERAEITGPFIAHIEAGRKKPSLVTVQRLARALDLSLADLLKDEAENSKRADAPYLGQFARLIRGKSPAQKEGLLRVIRAAAGLLH